MNHRGLAPFFATNCFSGTFSASRRETRGLPPSSRAMIPQTSKVLREIYSDFLRPQKTPPQRDAVRGGVSESCVRESETSPPEGRRLVKYSAGLIFGRSLFHSNKRPNRKLRPGKKCSAREFEWPLLSPWYCPQFGRRCLPAFSGVPRSGQDPCGLASPIAKRILEDRRASNTAIPIRSPRGGRPHAAWQDPCGLARSVRPGKKRGAAPQM